MTAASGIVKGKHTQFSANITGICTASSAKDKCPTKHCTVLLVKVIEGHLTLHQSIDIFIDGMGVRKADLVMRIERQDYSVGDAITGDEVGLCLYESDITDLLPAAAKKSVSCD